MIGRMFSPMTGPMLSGMFPRESKYDGVIFTPELIKLLIEHRFKRAYERTVL